MASVMQSCGWCKEIVKHPVMSMDEAGTGVLDKPVCPKCGAGLLPFETPDKVARVSSAGDPAKQQGDTVWAAGKGP